MEFIKNDANYDFMGRRHVFFGISAALVLAALIALFVLGFNKGIDFVGGSKIVVSMKPDSNVQRADLGQVLNDLIAKEIGSADVGQIDVQDFDTGSGGSVDEKNFLLLTELTSLVTDAKKDELKKTLEGLFPAARIDYAAEGQDRFYISVAEKVSVLETYNKIRDAFHAAGYPKVNVTADAERQLDVANCRTLQMLAHEEGEADVAATAQREQNLSKEKEEELLKARDNSYTVTIEELKAKLEATMREKYGPAFIAVKSSTSVSPSVAGGMFNQGLVAILYAIIGIIIYITLRFDVRYAPGAIIALIHDVVLVVGCFSLAQIKFSMPIIAAILTIAGYSINDTIVVFDRIRETIEKYPNAPMRAIINQAINNTLSRTILTSFTTFLTVLAIFLLGGGLIQDFAFAMCIGVIVGTYSSVFVASPLFLTLHGLFERRKTDNEEGEIAAAARG